MKKISVVLCCISLVVAIITLVNIMLYRASENVSSEDKRTTRIEISVLELSGEPIEGANVYVVETGKFYLTGANGSVEIDCYTEGEARWGAVTLCVFKKGYVDYLLYNCTVYADRVRRGPTIRLFKVEEDSPEITVFSENPPDEYSKEFIRRVKELAEKRNSARLL